MRICAVCYSSKYLILHRQDFITINKIFYYNVVICKNCGFAYATLLLSQQKLDTFYKKNLKYIYKVTEEKIPERLIFAHTDFFNFINKQVKKITNFDKKNFNILDVGCGNGHQLYCFKENGYRNILGIDPAPECSIFAKKKYNIRVIPSTIASFKTNKKFNLIIFQSVFEHIEDLKNTLNKTVKLLDEKGVIAISVPSAENFGKIVKEPYMEFSLEHINYFTRNSLINLFESYGLINISSESKPVDSFGTYVLNSIWQYSGKKNKIKYDNTGYKSLIKYIFKSKRRLNLIRKKIDYIIGQNREIYVWGAGSLTSRLLTTTNLSKAKIINFIDNNPSFLGKKINGKSILTSSNLENKKNPILISTFFFKDEIKNILKNKYKYQGKIITI